MSSHSRLEIAFIDTTLPDYQTLIDGLTSDVEVVLIDSDSGGFQQMADALNGREGIDAIHLLSHGNSGAVYLADDVLNTETLDVHARTLAAIRSSLAEDGDLLLYGCNVGQDGEGQEFIDTLGAITGADVAASDDLTGDAEQGGDWDLETSVGEISTTITLEDYSSVFAVDQVNNNRASVYVRPGEDSYYWTWGLGAGTNAQTTSISMHNVPDPGFNWYIDQGEFQYSSDNGTNWTTYNIGNSSNFVSTAGTIWKFVAPEGMTDDIIGFGYYVQGDARVWGGSGLNVKVDEIGRAHV